MLRKTPASSEEVNGSNPFDWSNHFGENVFSIKTMRNYLSERAYRLLIATILKADALDESIADEVAEAMKTWAIEKGATHFCG